MKDFRNKSALITGGSSGIGLALARELVGKGCSVTLLARRIDLLNQARDELSLLLPTDSSPVGIIQADVVDPIELNEQLGGYIAQHGLPDIVINSAGVSHPGTFSSLKPAIFHWLMDVNYFGMVNVLKQVVPGMQKRRSGTIINISSIAGFIGLYGYTAYGASKFAVAGFTDALRSELKPYGIRVSIVFPPDTQTPQLDYEKEFKPFVTQQLSGSARLMSADDVAREIIKKVMKNKYIILPGSEGKLLYTVKNIIGRIQYPVVDYLVRDAMRKIKFGS